MNPNGVIFTLIPTRWYFKMIFDGTSAMKGARRRKCPRPMEARMRLWLQALWPLMHTQIWHRYLPRMASLCVP